MVGRTLFEISDEMLELETKLCDSEGDLDSLGKEFEIIFDGTHEEIGFKLDGYAALIHEMKTRAKIRKDEAKRMSSRAKIDEANADFLLKRMKEVFIRHSWKVFETKRFRLSLAKHGGKLPLVFASPEMKEDPEANIPLEYLKTTIIKDIDNEAIRSHLDEGIELDFVQYGERGEGIRIK